MGIFIFWDLQNGINIIIQFGELLWCAGTAQESIMNSFSKQWRIDNESLRIVYRLTLATGYEMMVDFEKDQIARFGGGADAFDAAAVGGTDERVRRVRVQIDPTQFLILNQHQPVENVIIVIFQWIVDIFYQVLFRIYSISWFVMYVYLNNDELLIDEQRWCSTSRITQRCLGIKENVIMHT